MTDPDDKPFRFRAGESLRDGVRRIACHEIDAVIDALSGAPDAETVHEVRKATKRLRALLRLVRDHLGERCYERENLTFRDAARALSPARDAEVLAATADQLAPRLDGRRGALAPIRRAARERLRAAHADAHPRKTAKRIVGSLRRARARVATWPLPAGGWGALAPGVRRTYKRGRAGWHDAASKPTVTRLHEWRKRAKDLRYTLDLLEPVWPAVVKAMADETDALADRLGEDHDLALLRRFARDVAEDGATEREVLTVIDGARRKLPADAWALAARIYDTGSQRFSRRMESYWRAWKAEATPEDEDAIAAAPSDERRLALSATMSR